MKIPRILENLWLHLPDGFRRTLHTMTPDASDPRVQRAGLVLCAVIGMFAGLGGFTFHYAKGTSYLSSDPKVCINCHIMNDQYASWEKSSHRKAARCVDCHLPHAILPKLIAKGDTGFRHSKAFTFQDFHEPIQITPHDKGIVEENCIRCHQDMTHSMRAFRSQKQKDLSCIKCHPTVGHSMNY